jgi:hypothetical protein
VTIWAPAVALGITLPALLLPDGRLRSRRWRLVAATAVAGPVMFVGGAVAIPGPSSDTPVPFENPLGLPGPAGAVARAVAFAGLGLHAVSLLAALACVALRFRAARGVERQQLRWVAAGAAVAVVVLLPLPGKARLADAATPLALLCVPVSVAVLRYRLWKLDRLVSRTVTYALVTGLLVLPSLIIVPAAGHLAHGSGTLGVAAATLAAAATFQPLRRRVQDLVDRRFNRRRYDAARTGRPSGEVAVRAGRGRPAARGPGPSRPGPGGGRAGPGRGRRCRGRTARRPRPGRPAAAPGGSARGGRRRRGGARARAWPGGG